LLWNTLRSAPGNGTSMTYRHGAVGKHFVLIAAGGYSTFGTELADTLVAFALDEN